MITEYYRPQTIDEAILLLSKPGSHPLAGGTTLNLYQEKPIIAVDLQALGLREIHKVGDRLEVGAMVDLQTLSESEYIQKDFKQAIQLEATINLRNMGTVAGSLVACKGRSPFLTTILALDPKIILYPTSDPVSLGDLLPLRSDQLRGKLITQIDIPMNLRVVYEYIARTPKDRPIISVALARWPSGRTRVIIGGWGSIPFLALDGILQSKDDFSSIEHSAQNITSDSTDDWSSSEYRSAMAVILARRCWERIFITQAPSQEK